MPRVFRGERFGHRERAFEIRPSLVGEAPIVVGRAHATVPHVREQPDQPELRLRLLGAAFRGPRDRALDRAGRGLTPGERLLLPDRPQRAPWA
jgi:hypothetical protein